MTEQLYKWMLPGDRTAVQRKPWPVGIGEWTPKETLSLCKSGWHGMKEKDVLNHFPAVGAKLYVVETRGQIVHGNDKFAAEQLRLVRMIGTTTERNLLLFAADCAQDVLPLFRKVSPNDMRPRDAIAVARRYAVGSATKAELAAAGAAARDAAWAAGDAARDAAWAAGAAAAGAAARDAAWAAGDAANAAAGAAARAAWDDAARAKYSNWLVVRLESGY